METQYAAIAQDYHRHIESLPYMRACDWTVRHAIGDPTNQAILDFGCGEGYFARQLKKAGARLVVGFDLEPSMIKLALARELAEPLGIQYTVSDARYMRAFDGMNLVTAKFIFNYAQSLTELEAMAYSAYSNLAPGGRILAVVPDFSQGLPTSGKYGFTAQATLPLTEGGPVSVTLNGVQPFEARYWHPASYAQAFKKIGLRTNWLPLQISLADLQHFGPEFWQGFLDQPYCRVLEAVND